MVQRFAFTRENGAYLVTVPTPAGDWRTLDGRITTHDHGRVVCIDIHEPVDVDALAAAFTRWQAGKMYGLDISFL